MEKRVGWSIVFYFVDDPEDYRAFILSPFSRYKDPHEWEERNNNIRRDRQVKLVDYRALPEGVYIKEYHNYYKNYRDEWYRYK